MAKDYLIDEATGKPYVEGNKGKYLVNLNTGKKFEYGDKREDGFWFERFYNFIADDGFYLLKWIPKGVHGYERNNPDTGVPFERGDPRPKGVQTDGSKYPQDGKIFYLYSYTTLALMNEDYYFKERWVDPVKLNCLDCGIEFDGVKGKGRFCKYHRQRRIYRTPERMKEWKRTNSKPCESSISIGEATGCRGKTHKLSNFHTGNETTNSRNLGFPSYCKPCYKESRWRIGMRHTYKGEITADEYYFMLHKQGNVCKICGTDEIGTRVNEHTGEIIKLERWIIDHQEDPYMIRGLLCDQCNTGIGSLKHSINNLKSSIEYLKDPPMVKAKEEFRKQDVRVFKKPD
tara:strand:+ start:4175 stop:5206 length:1032 start_codon:yes stop_codon:yes gene_type:complete